MPHNRAYSCWVAKSRRSRHREAAARSAVSGRELVAFFHLGIDWGAVSTCDQIGGVPKGASRRACSASAAPNQRLG